MIISVTKKQTSLAATSAVWAVEVVMSAFAFLAPSPAVAYTGPGAGLTAIGSLLALIAAVLLAIVGFIWYPIRRLRRRMRARREAAANRKSKDAAPQ